MISRTVKLSTNLALGGQVETLGPSFVPWGIPPFRDRKDEVRSPMPVICVRPCRNAATHLSKAACMLNFESFWMRMWWSIRSI